MSGTIPDDEIVAIIKYWKEKVSICATICESSLHKGDCVGEYMTGKTDGLQFCVETLECLLKHFKED